jgi:hypothetical protein
MKKFFPTELTKKQVTDAGMAAVLLLLLIGFFTGNILYYKIAIAAQVLNMAVPMVYYPFAVIWLGLTTLLGEVVSKVILSVVYFLILMPVGLVRKMMGKDTLQLKGFKKATSSVMITRNHNFTSKDIETPY